MGAAPRSRRRNGDLKAASARAALVDSVAKTVRVAFVFNTDI